jgi:hypothetical protein
MGQGGLLRVDQAHRGYCASSDQAGYSALNPLYMRCALHRPPACRICCLPACLAGWLRCFAMSMGSLCCTAGAATHSTATHRCTCRVLCVVPLAGLRRVLLNVLLEALLRESGYSGCCTGQCPASAARGSAVDAVQCTPPPSLLLVALRGCHCLC